MPRLRTMASFVALALTVGACGKEADRTSLQQSSTGATGATSTTTTPDAAPAAGIKCSNSQFVLTLPAGWAANRDKDPSKACVALAYNVKPALLEGGLFQLPDDEDELDAYPIFVKAEPTWDASGTVAGVVQLNRGVRPAVSRDAAGRYALAETNAEVSLTNLPPPPGAKSAVTVETTTKGALDGLPDGTVRTYHIFERANGGVVFARLTSVPEQDRAATRAAFDAIAASIVITEEK